MTNGIPYSILPHFDQETQKYNAKCSSNCTWMHFPFLLLYPQYPWQCISWSCPSKPIRNHIRRHLAVKAPSDTHPLQTSLPSLVTPPVPHDIFHEKCILCSRWLLSFRSMGATRSPINRATRPRATISLVGRVSWQGEPPYLGTFSCSAAPQ